MDLTSKFADFFRSPHKTLKEFNEALNESASANAWSEAVTLWRTGIKKMKENDLTGIDDIKKANETLKTVVTKKPVEGVDKQLNQLNESVNSFNNENMEEEIEMLEYQVGSLVDSLHANGVELAENDDEFELDGCVDPTPTPNTPAVAPAASTEPAKAPEAAKPEAAPVAAPVATEPKKEPEAAPVVETIQPKKSGYAEGFAAGQLRYKKGEKLKEMVKKIVEGELFEQPYAFVQRYQEGFAAGFAYQEEVQRDMTPHLYEDSDSSGN
jgi:hypothetical protein